MFYENGVLLIGVSYEECEYCVMLAFKAEKLFIIALHSPYFLSLDP